jgi:hypothetical protein
MMIYERALYSAGLRGAMTDPKTEKSRLSGSSLSFESLLLSLTIPNSPNADKRPLSPQPQSISPIVLPQCTLHNAGNNAVMCLFALQKLLEPTGTLVPSIKTRGPKPGTAGGLMINSAAGAGGFMKINGGTPSPNMHYPGFAFAMTTSNSMPRMQSAYDLASEFGQMQINMPRATFASLGHSRPNDIKISKRTSVINLLGDRGNLK